MASIAYEHYCWKFEPDSTTSSARPHRAVGAPTQAFPQKNLCKHWVNCTIGASVDRKPAVAPFLKTQRAVMFRRLSQIATVILVLLVACPMTAPFASFDLAAGTTPVEEMLDTSSKVTVVVPVILPFLLRIEPVDAQALHHPVVVIRQDDPSPRLSVLRV
jgi:hypothetical protein